jgi:hypothetical protein
MADREQSIMERLDDQIAWYEGRSAKNQKYYKSLKVASMVTTGLIPVLAGFGLPAPVGGAFGFLALICEGLQQLNQHHNNWISYRSTSEALKHEKYLYGAHAGHYRDASDPLALLAEQIESLVSVEHAKWVSTRRETDAKQADVKG